jgi:hypothetical protein
VSAAIEIDRRRVALVANEGARGSTRLGAPRLSEESPRGEIVRWLQWNDPNGCHSDARAIAEGFDPYTLDTAWEALEEMVKDDM